MSDASGAVILSEKVALLRKILEVESKNGYSDHAVIGGLDRFLHRWAGSLRESIKEPALLRNFNNLGLVSPGYASLDREQRREWVKGVQEWLGRARKASEGGVTALSSHRRQTARKGAQLSVTAASLDSTVASVKGVNAATADILHFKMMQK